MNGKTINGFTLQRLLGIGGMAEVWYAENKIHKPAAVKILNEDLSHNATIVERFRNEAEIMVKLKHPNIRQVYDFDDIDGRQAIIMEYLEGSDLKAMMKSGKRFTDAELKRWWDQLVSALNYTHGKGIVHRDIKPGNIFVDEEGNIKLLDFGIAKIKEGISMTQTGAMMGTLMYMSPEQVDDSKHIGPKSDIYSLAVTFVHLITGRAPYDTANTSDFKIRESIVYKPLDMTGVPADWQAFLKPYLAKDPDERPALRPFETMVQEDQTVINTQVAPIAIAAPDADEGTVVAETGKPTQPMKPKENPTNETPQKPKSKKGLWIGLAAVVAVVALVLFLHPNEYKRIDEQLNKSSELYEKYEIIARMDDYSLNINYLNKGYECCLNAAASLAELEDSTAVETLKRMQRCDSLVRLYSDNVRYYLNQELDSLFPDSDTTAIVKKIRQLERFSVISADTVLLDSLAREIETRKRDFVFNVNGVSFVMKKVEGGTFWMGAQKTSSNGQNYDSDADGDESPVHSVTVSSFYMGETEVTQALWEAVMGTTVRQQRDKADTSWPLRGEGDNYPMYYVNWKECQEFVVELNRLTGKNFRLPTEAEWEYATKGGNKGNGYKYAGSQSIDSVAWYTDNSGGNTHPVKGKKPNELGLYDMSGNVYEWCSDWYGKEYYSSSPSTNPKGPSSGSYRVLRGGSWASLARYCRVSGRGGTSPDIRGNPYGFRLALPQ